jgi:hypothetical protein
MQRRTFLLWGLIAAAAAVAAFVLLERAAFWWRETRWTQRQAQHACPQAFSESQALLPPTDGWGQSLKAALLDLRWVCCHAIVLDPATLQDDAEAPRRSLTYYMAHAEAAAQAPAQLPALRVHVKSDYIKAWLRHTYPALLQEFRRRRHAGLPAPQVVLLTSLSDHSARCRAGLSVDGLRRLQREGLLRAWFMQNYDAPSNLAQDLLAFLKPLPIGVALPRPGFAEEDRMLTQLVETRSRPWQERQALVFSDTHLSVKTNRRERKAAAAAVEGLPFVDKLAARLPKVDFWARMQDCQFVLSPPGNGLDCHRTWEALILGSVPIVKRTSLARMFEEDDFPVVQVTSYDELRAEGFLARAQASMAPKLEAFDRRKLLANYWRQRVQACADSS